MKREKERGIALVLALGMLMIILGMSFALETRLFGSNAEAIRFFQKARISILAQNSGQLFLNEIRTGRLTPVDGQQWRPEILTKIPGFVIENAECKKMEQPDHWKLLLRFSAEHQGMRISRTAEMQFIIAGTDCRLLNIIYQPS
jgi:hypothetical protein